MEEIFKVGVITAPHGVRGEVKVFPTTDEPKRFGRLKTVLVEQGCEKLPYAVQSVKFFKNMVILKLEGISSMDEAQKYRQCSLYVPRKDAIPLKKGEYYVADLIGMEVYAEDWENLFGRLTDVMRTGANDVYVIDTETQGEVLLPAIKDCVLAVCPEEGKMLVHILPGLI